MPNAYRNVVRICKKCACDCDLSLPPQHDLSGRRKARLVLANLAPYFTMIWIDLLSRSLTFSGSLMGGMRECETKQRAVHVSSKKNLGGEGGEFHYLACIGKKWVRVHRKVGSLMKKVWWSEKSVQRLFQQDIPCFFELTVEYEDLFPDFPCSASRKLQDLFNLIHLRRLLHHPIQNPNW